MRIIAGEYRGRGLKTAVGPGYRPAMSRVRAALFSMLEARGWDWPACRALDLFAGSGSLGFEALSRGAGQVCFVESLPRAAALIRENATRLGVAPGRCQVLEAEVGAALSRRPHLPYDLVFVDPPYGKRILVSAILAALRRGWLKPGGILSAEVEGVADFDPAHTDPALEPAEDRRYGQTRLVLWNIKAM